MLVIQKEFKAKKKTGQQSSSTQQKKQTQQEQSTDDTQMKWKDGFKYADDFTNGKIEWEEGQEINRVDLEEKIRVDTSSIFKLLVAVGTALTVIVGAILGVNFIMASAEEKAKIKEKMIPYIVGSFVIYGAITIWLVVVRILGEIG